MVFLNTVTSVALPYFIQLREVGTAAAESLERSSAGQADTGGCGAASCLQGGCCPPQGMTPYLTLAITGTTSGPGLKTYTYCA